MAILNDIKNGKTWCPYCAGNNIKNNKTWCPYCANNRPCTLEDAKQVACNRNGMCLSKYFINNRSALLWMCDKKHRWFATLNIQTRGAHFVRNIKEKSYVMRF